MRKVCIDDWVVVEIPEMLHGSSFKLLHLKANTILNLGKKLGKISAEKFSGLAYDCFWEIVGSNDGSIQPWKPESLSCSTIHHHSAEEEDTGDNKDYFDDNSAQLLDVKQLSHFKSTLTSQELVEKLVQNSTTFSMKTKFAQDKYKRRKSLKYAKVFKILPSNSNALLKNFFAKAMDKILGIRQDSLSMILSLGNVQAGMKALVLDESHGMISLAMLERMKSSEDFPWMMTFVKSFFPDILYNSSQSKDYHSNFTIIPIDSLIKGENFHSSSVQTDSDTVAAAIAAKYIRVQKAIDLFQNSQYDVLIIAVKDKDPLECLRILAPGLAFSRSVVIYSPTRESLLECHEEMMKNCAFINVNIYEPFLREYQVLPGRMHPHMKTSGGGGYILSAIKVDE